MVPRSRSDNANFARGRRFNPCNGRRFYFTDTSINLYLNDMKFKLSETIRFLLPYHVRLAQLVERLHFVCSTINLAGGRRFNPCNGRRFFVSYLVQNLYLCLLDFQSILCWIGASFISYFVCILLDLVFQYFYLHNLVNV